MIRQDYDLPFMLRYNNVAWYESGQVKILDRRIYPQEVRFVTCTTHREVAQAIADMVTQSAGPYTAAGMGMALAAFEARDMDDEAMYRYLEAASETISHARPTTANRMGQITRACLDVAKTARAKGQAVDVAIFESTVDALNRRYSIMEKVGKHLCGLIPHHGRVLTQCFGETIIGMMLRILKHEGKDVAFYCCETRPYYQGARLTATCSQQMGFETTVITDNAAAYVMKTIGIDLFTSAADTIATDGHIANKIGTYQLAILAQHFHIPYYVTGIPDKDKASVADITIEMRSPSDMLEGRTHTGVKGLYPAFDITPPELITGVVTDKGVYKADRLGTYFDTTTEQFY
ncbi:s-methyl-5-thioribose-1-phosphate isomerase [Peptoniphilus equinus]|uniref:S-methyl-5-thioribose-1-phosphate isomerase n=1 Tax=Peptoniphilus equinus TaxID=3016343 RepID=A0ABY7QS20_9FIRM|nr:s-methyl-5-thioribose-1-phosphate isomerase [Peptoniphilus equinus]WBW49557.1 s-methyl-5-thioribose-1-phosphate isomerase [Peptoniphilus equinus]